MINSDKRQELLKVLNEEQKRQEWLEELERQVLLEVLDKEQKRRKVAALAMKQTKLNN